MKLGKIFICINILVLSLLIMSYWTFDNRIIDIPLIRIPYYVYDGADFFVFRK